MGGEVGMSLVVKSSHCLPSVRLMGFRAWGLFCIAVYSFVYPQNVYYITLVEIQR